MTVQEIERTSETLTTRSGVAFQVRPAQPTDEARLAEFFENVSHDDLRFRFLSALNTVGHNQLALMANVDHDRTENLLAYLVDDNSIIASAMLAADADGKRAEVAMAIRADYKHKGISWTMLDHVARLAKSKGIQTLESIEAHDHHEAIEMEREMGFTASPCPGDATLVLLRAKLNQ